MRTIKQMIDALLGEKRSPEIRRGPHTVTTGIVRVGSNLELCWAHDKRRGVMLVTMTVEQLTRLDRIQQEHKAAQEELKALPKSRRARKRKMKIVSLPPNPQNASRDSGKEGPDSGSNPGVRSALVASSSPTEKALSAASTSGPLAGHAAAIEGKA